MQVHIILNVTVAALHFTHAHKTMTGIGEWRKMQSGVIRDIGGDRLLFNNLKNKINNQGGTKEGKYGKRV